MKITTVKTSVLRVPLGDDRFYSSQAAFPERNSLLVRVETDDGRVGWGEGGQYGPPEPVQACIDHVLAPSLLGRSPLDVGRIWDESYATTRDFGQKGTYVEAMSALDIALWDLKGQALGVPISDAPGRWVQRQHRGLRDRLLLPRRARLSTSRLRWTPSVPRPRHMPRPVSAFSR